MQAAKVAVNAVLRRVGYQVTRYSPEAAPSGPGLPRDFSEEDRQLWDRVSAHTMVSPERIYSLARCIEYVVANKIAGSLVECGVWKGGCALAMALTLDRIGEKGRDLYLYDTFDEGWPEAGPDDVTVDGKTGHEMWLEARAAGLTPDDLWGQFARVRELLHGSDYPEERLHLVKGKVEDTIPGVAPERIAVLRLDTDWYESTRHELEHLYPRLEPGGVLIIDDYGLWRGARKAVDEYFERHDVAMLLHRVDADGCRVGVKR